MEERERERESANTQFVRMYVCEKVRGVHSARERERERERETDLNFIREEEQRTLKRISR